MWKCLRILIYFSLNKLIIITWNIWEWCRSNTVARSSRRCMVVAVCCSAECPCCRYLEMRGKCWRKKSFFLLLIGKKMKSFFFCIRKRKIQIFYSKFFILILFFMPNSTRWHNMPPYIAKIPPDANSARQLHDAFPLPCLGRALLVHHLRQHLVQQAKSLLQNKNIL